MCFLVSYFFHVLFLLSTLRLARHEVTHSQNGNLNTPRRPAPAEGARARLQDDRPLRRQLSRRAQARAPALLRPAARGTVPAGSSCSSSWLPSGGDSPGHCVSLPGRKCAGGLRAGSASGARAPSRRGLQPLGVAAAPGALSVRGGDSVACFSRALFLAKCPFLLICLFPVDWALSYCWSSGCYAPVNARPSPTCFTP